MTGYGEQGGISIQSDGQDMIIALTVLPSWINSGPKAFEFSLHGKLTAASEWRTTVLMHDMSITSPWLLTDWRKLGILDNVIDYFEHTKSRRESQST